jgi:hypothetical protein
MTEPTAESPTEAPPAPVQSAQTSETDWKAEARKWEQRAKENYGRLQEVQPLADQFRQLEEASKTEAQRMQEALEASNRARDEQAAETLRMRVAMKHGLAADDLDLLNGAGDEEQLSARAQRLAELKKAAEAAQQQSGPPPAAHTVANLRPGAVPAEPTPSDDQAVYEAQFAQAFRRTQ